MPPHLAYTLPTVAAVPRVSDVPLARSHSLIPRRVLADVVRMTDFLVASLAGLAVAALSSYGMFAAHAAGHLVALAATSVMLVLVLDRLGLYQVSKFASIVAQIPWIVLTWALVLTALAAGAYWLNLGELFSRTWLPAWMAAGVTGVIVERSLVACLVRHWTTTGRLYRRAVI